MRWVTAGALFAGINWTLLAPASAFDAIVGLLPNEDKIAHDAMFLALVWTLFKAAAVAGRLPGGRAVRFAAQGTGEGGGFPDGRGGQGR